MSSASSDEGSGGGPKSSIIDSVEADTFDSALGLMNAYVSKEINLSHCKMIAISKDLAKDGIRKEIYSLTNKVQVGSDTYIIVTTCPSEEYIKSISPSLENLVAKFYEFLPRSGEYTGYTIDTQLGRFC